MCAGLFCNTAAHLIDNELSVLFCDSVSTKSRSLSELHVLWAICQTRIIFVDQLVWYFVGFSPKETASEVFVPAAENTKIHENTYT